MGDLWPTATESEISTMSASWGYVAQDSFAFLRDTEICEMVLYQGHIVTIVLDMDSDTA